MSYVDMLLTGLIAFLSGRIGAYVILKLTLNKAKNELPDMILDLIDEIVPVLPKVLAKDEVRQFVYSLGVLVGNGAKSGALGQTGKGKFKFENLLGEIAQAVAPQIVQKALKIIPGNTGDGNEQQSGGNWG